MGDADAGDDAKSEAALEECVRLLSSDSREKKFVGMLLVTRLVPDADDVPASLDVGTTLGRRGPAQARMAAA